MTEAYMLPEAIKGQQWEITKGHLRAMVSIQGSFCTNTQLSQAKYTRLKELVDSFIGMVEYNALHE